MTLPDEHLDLGCGPIPRNPYGRAHLRGIDIRRPDNAPAGVDVRVANLIVEPIPFPDNQFGSVSAFDFLEHVPRLLPGPDGKGTVLPFVRLMSEIWRVLAPGGRFFALTPAYPGAPAFQDPTHVNFITEATHSYFCEPDNYARIYGFTGKFRALRREWVMPEDALASGSRSWRQSWRHWRRSVRGRLTHLVWELEAVKPPA